MIEKVQKEVKYVSENHMCVHLIQFRVSFIMFVFDRKDEDPEQKIEFKTRLGEFRVHLSVCV